MLLIYTLHPKLRRAGIWYDWIFFFLLDCSSHLSGHHLSLLTRNLLLTR
ncbi:unnamed protein product [Brugia timori]|uniref:Uncharacterized protein n=1 Tax=Brugia timori TaxID=42155 RepID=A0A3P7VP67_9BILA|nr:unnamed protein product [Brugia timori]